MEILLCMVTSILKSGESIHTSHVKIFKGILLSLLMAIARGWLSLYWWYSFNLKHAKLLCTFRIKCHGIWDRQHSKMCLKAWQRILVMTLFPSASSLKAVKYCHCTTGAEELFTYRSASGKLKYFQLKIFKTSNLVIDWGAVLMQLTRMAECLKICGASAGGHLTRCKLCGSGWLPSCLLLVGPWK